MRKIKIGYNDMWTTNPELAKLLADPQDGYKYMEHSGKYVDWKCPSCGNIIKHKQINMVSRQKLSCPKCSDKFPYTEKFMYSFLQELNINFIYQLTKKDLKWCKNYKYDFYFKINNKEYVIETHGLGHYQEGFGRCGGRTLKEEQENDKNKKELAIKNNIKEENYIAIDCRYSTLKWIKDYILDSRLNDIFDLSKIDWLKCHEYACNSLVKKVCELWNSGVHSTIEIGKIMKMSFPTVILYLKRGKKLNWCKYDSKKEYNKSFDKMHKKTKRKIICLNNEQIFNSITDASSQMNINISSICLCCENKRKISGKKLKTKEYLQWQYYDEYLIKPKKLLSNKEIDEINNKEELYV